MIQYACDIDESSCHFCGDDRVQLSYFDHRKKIGKRWWRKYVMCCRECMMELTVGIINNSPVHFVGNTAPAEHETELEYHGTGRYGRIGETWEEDDASNRDPFTPYMREFA